MSNSGICLGSGRHCQYLQPDIYSQLTWQKDFIYYYKMDDELIFSQLSELAEKLGILIRDEKINIEESFCVGGLCRLKGKYILMLNSQSTVQEKIQVMLKALQQFDFSDIYLRPVIRELLEGDQQ